MAKMPDSELEAIVGSEIEDAISYIDNDISTDRAIATNYYLGRPFGDEQEGRSQIVSQDVRDTVNSVMPSLMRIFCGTDRVVEFSPRTQDDVKKAEQATDYCNYVYMTDNDGYKNLFFTFKDAMIRKVGIQKIWWDEKEEVTQEDYTGLDEGTVAVLMNEPEAEVDVTGVEYRELPAIDPMTGQPTVTQQPLYNCTVKRVTKEGKICVAVLPPEEFLISRRGRSFEESSIIAHRAMMTVSELVAMGLDEDMVKEQATDDEFWNNEEYIDRSNWTQYEQGSSSNELMRRVLYIEAYVLVDYDGDGIAERRKICTIGPGYKIVSNEPCNYIPFAEFVVDPEPHLPCVEATSTADKVMDIQRLKSNVWRNSLDAMAQTINPRTVVLEGQVNIQDVLNNEVGAVIRAQNMDAIREMQQSPVFQQAFGMLEYIDGVKESRTGISKAAQGMSPDALQATAAGAANAIVAASQSQMELIARNLADGLRKAFKIMLYLMTTHQDKPRTIRLRNEWVTIDPRTWNRNMDVSISVAIGSGSNQEKLAALNAIAQKQEMILQQLGPSNPLVTLAQYSETLSKMIQYAGFVNSQSFVNRLPDDFQMPEQAPQEDPQSKAAELLAQVEREKAQMKMQVDAAKMQAQQQVEEAKLMLEREQMQADMARKQLELEMQSQKMQAELQIKEAEIILRQLQQQSVKNENSQETEQEAPDAQKEGLLAQAIALLSAQIAQGQQQTAQALNAPKRVIRDQTGRVVGVEPVEPMEPEND